MRRIKLTNIGSALIDDNDYNDISQFSWYMSKSGYAARSAREDGKTITIYMHRSITDAPTGMDVDHIDMNKINNTRINLRIVTRSQNMMNSRKAKAATAISKYKGVSKLNRPNLKKPWIAYTRLDYKIIYLGYHATPEEAALAYNVKALELFGDHAQLNVIDSKAKED